MIILKKIKNNFNNDINNGNNEKDNCINDTDYSNNANNNHNKSRMIIMATTITTAWTESPKPKQEQQPAQHAQPDAPLGPTHLGEGGPRVVHDGVEVIALAQGVDLFRRQLVEVVVLTLHGEGERSEVSHQVVQTARVQLPCI